MDFIKNKITKNNDYYFMFRLNNNFLKLKSRFYNDILISKILTINW